MCVILRFTPSCPISLEPKAYSSFLSARLITARPETHLSDKECARYHRPQLSRYVAATLDRQRSKPFQLIRRFQVGPDHGERSLRRVRTLVLLPITYISPYSVSKMVWPIPAPTRAIFIGHCIPSFFTTTGVGVGTFPVVPVPSWPCSLLPKAYTSLAPVTSTQKHLTYLLSEYQLLLERKLVHKGRRADIHPHGLPNAKKPILQRNLIVQQ